MARYYSRRDWPKKDQLFSLLLFLPRLPMNKSVPAAAESGDGMQIIAASPGIQRLSAIRGPVIILDSSFNPPTNAHVALLQAAARRVQSTDPEGPPPLVLLSLSLANADKGAIGAADVAQRRAWLSALVGHLSDTGLAAAALAVLLGDAGLFVQKRQRLHDLLPGAGRLIFLMGDDTLQRFLNPAYYHAIVPQLTDFFADAEIYAAPRIEGDHLKEALGSWGGPLLRQVLEDRVHILPLPESCREISSTMVRSLWRAQVAAALPDAHGKLLQELVPSCIRPPAASDNLCQ